MLVSDTCLPPGTKKTERKMSSLCISRPSGLELEYLNIKKRIILEKAQEIGRFLKGDRGKERNEFFYQKV